MKGWRPQIFLDLDRTLFRTNQITDVFREIEHQFQVNGEMFRDDIYRSFYVHNAAGCYYDLSSHLYGLGLDAEEVYDYLIKTSLADGRFEHIGVKELVDILKTVADVRVLTYGEDKYQRFKAQLCPSLREVDIIATLGFKGEALSGHGECWLVDDKPIGDQLPSNVKFIQVELEKDGIPDRLPDWPYFSSLERVKDFFLGLDDLS